MSKTVAPLTAQTNSENTAYLDAMGDSQQDTWSVKIHIGLQEATFKIDTGTEVTAISEMLYKSRNATITTTASHLPISGPVSACKGLPQPFQGHPSTIVCLKCLRKQSQQKQTCLLLVVCQWWLVSL